MREIVTLQLGNYSNHVATHFWNAQESYFTYEDDEKKSQSPVDHDVHWRAGISADGSDTFLPRTVIYDLKGGFGPLKKINPLYDTVKAGSDADSAYDFDFLWPGKPAIHKQTPLEISPYQKALDLGTQPAKLTSSSIRYWSDYSRVYFHPRSLIPLYDFEVQSTIMPFERFEMGTELFRSLEKEDDIVDRDVRPFVEECDQMQGLQLFATLDDAWGGFASSYIEALRDEHPKTCIWLWGLETPTADISREARRLRLGNVAQSLYQSCSQASMVMPLAVPGRLPPTLSLNVSSAWQTSALLATAAESLLLPSRLRTDARRSTQPVSVSELMQNLNIAGNQTLANARMAIGSQAENSTGHHPPDMDLSKVGVIGDQAVKDDGNGFFGCISTLRGFDDVEEPGNGSGKNDDGEGTREREEELRRRPLIGSAVLQSYTSPLKFPLLDSYPSIYLQAAGQAGVRVHATLSTDKSIAARMKQLRAQVAGAIGSDSREDLSNGLAGIGDAYQDDWSSGSDMDDDDL